MYVPSNSPIYNCRGCRNKISIADLDGIFCEEIKDYSLSPDAIAKYLKSANETANEKEPFSFGSERVGPIIITYSSLHRWILMNSYRMDLFRRHWLQVHNWRSRERYWIASEICSPAISSAPARSAMVRATFNTRS